MGSALETLCGQAFGAGQVHMLGVYMQRSWIILMASSCVLLPIYIWATPILKLLGQADEIAELAGKFALLTIPNLFALSLTFPAQKFLQSQSKVNVLAWIGGIALLCQVLLLWLFIYVFHWGIIGAAVAYDITTWGIPIAQCIYIFGWCKVGWRGFSIEAFHDLWAFLGLSIASAVMICLEIWYMMSIIILTGHLANAVLAVGSLSICININGYEGILFIGVNAAVSVRVSNELGCRRPRAAKYAVAVAVFQSLVIGLSCMVIILIVRDYIGIVFTSSKELQKEVAKLASLLGVTMVLNSVQPVISGAAIGAGWQGLVAYINLGCYYIFGLPLGYLLGYTAHLNVFGLWGGMIAGMALQTLLLLIILYRTNWTKEVEQSSERMKKWGGQNVVPVEEEEEIAINGA
ncbi:protein DETOXIFICATION 35-like [Rutidosis leptorrhynchoides]|uniref:protein DETOXIFICATION 35-like n=1 Tax=Rutidosis leptorrhynchoides TaxID=125765 RepID=UPI003A9996D9